MDELIEKFNKGSIESPLDRTCRLHDNINLAESIKNPLSPGEYVNMSSICLSSVSRYKNYLQNIDENSYVDKQIYLYMKLYIDPMMHESTTLFQKFIMMQLIDLKLCFDIDK